MNFSDLQDIINIKRNSFEGAIAYHFNIKIDTNDEQVKRNPRLLTTVIRSLNNSTRMFNGQSFRSFFNQHFFGGCYKIRLAHEPGAYPVIHYHVVCFSKKGDPHNHLAADLAARMNMVVPNATMTISRVNDSTRAVELFATLDSIFYLTPRTAALLGQPMLDIILKILSKNLICFGLMRRFHVEFLWDSKNGFLSKAQSGEQQPNFRKPLKRCVWE